MTVAEAVSQELPLDLSDALELVREGLATRNTH